MNSASTVTDTPLQVDLIDPPDLTDMLQWGKKHIVAYGSFGSVYRCLCTQNGEVAVKAISFPHGRDRAKKDVLMRKVRYELGIWRRLDHPNIVPLLGTARGEGFGSDYPCMVSLWMPHGMLTDYFNHRGTMLSLTTRIHLVKGLVAGLEYLHSKQVVHGNLHPGNILIDREHNARLTDFGSSQVLSPVQDQLSDLWADFIRPHAVLWAAPELLCPDLYPKIKVEGMLHSDIYSLGSIILFIYSRESPWPNRREAEDKLKEFQNPPRPLWPANVPDDVWNLIERCWSPRLPRNRPSAGEILSFFKDEPQQLLQPDPVSNINVVLFGAPGSGKSSIIDLLAEAPITQVSTNVEPCTEQSQCYLISISGRQFRFWDTMGFHLGRKPDTDPLLLCEEVYTILRNLPDGINLILLCARKDEIFASLGSLYWLINDFFYGGRAAIAFVVTHSDTPDEQWWERNQDTITQRTGISVQSIPHACVTTVQTGRDQSKQVLKELLETYATVSAPIAPRLDLSSHVTFRNLATHLGLSLPEATALVERFSRLQHAHQEYPGKPSPLVSKTNSDTDLLEVEVPLSVPAAEFNYDESLSSVSSTNPCKDEPPLPHASRPTSQSSEALPTISPPEENSNIATSPQDILTLKRWVLTRIKKVNKEQVLHKPDQVPRESPLPANHQSSSQSPARVEATNSSWMAAARPKRRVVATSFRVPQDKRKSPTKPTQSNKGASCSGQSTTGPPETGPAHQVNNLPHPSAGRIHVTDQRESGYSIVSIRLRLPSWVLCRGSAAEDGIHG